VVFIEYVHAFCKHNSKQWEMAGKYSQDNRYGEITVEMLLTARDETGGGGHCPFLLFDVLMFTNKIIEEQNNNNP
jgi:hypothetical protein